MSRNILLQVFHESSSPKPLNFFRKAVEINQGAPVVSTTLAANFASGTAGVVDTWGKFDTGVNDTGGTACSFMGDQTTLGI